MNDKQAASVCSQPDRYISMSTEPISIKFAVLCLYGKLSTKFKFDSYRSYMTPNVREGHLEFLDFLRNDFLHYHSVVTSVWVALESSALILNILIW
jgi:hypothetical protein